ncbi:MAG: acetyltransferase [bacterium]|nr:acetyltransferase [bacterium]
MPHYSLQHLNLDEADHNPIRDRVLAWLARPHVREWWGEPDEAFALLLKRSVEQAAVFLCADNREIGCACWQTLSPEDREIIFGSPEAESGVASPTAKIMDVDLFIGEAAELGRGAGPAFLRRIAARIPGEYPGFRAGLCVAEENERSLRAALKAGFQKRHCFEDPEDGPTWLLIRSKDEQVGDDPDGAAAFFE